MNSKTEDNAVEAGVCIVGGGPAGMTLAHILARCGVQVTLLERHDDFDRDFRGDTISGVILFTPESWRSLINWIYPTKF